MSLLNLTDVKPHLKITQATDDAVLQAKLDSAEAYVARRLSTGTQLAEEEFTQRAAGCGKALVLTKGPVVSVTSVTGAYGDALVLADLDVDEAHGLIHYLPGGLIGFPDPFYTVVYQVGYATADDLPEDVVEVVRLMTQHFYATQRGSNRRATGGAPGTEPDAYARAQQILADLTTGGFA